MARKAIVLAALLGVASLVNAAPTLSARDEAPELHARPRLVAERQAVRPGEDVLVAIDFEIDEGWHTYWAGQNDTGFALHTKIACSANATCADLLWPAPHRYSPSEGILDHVYEHRMTVLLPVHIAEQARIGDSIELRVGMKWLVCETICLPESAELTMTLPVAEAASRPDPETSEMFEAARSRLPHPPTPADHVAVTLQGDALSIHVPGAGRLAFYPLEKARRPRDLIRDGEGEGDSLTIELRPGDEPVLGVVEAWDDEGDRSRLFQIDFPPTNGPSEPAGQP
ncbi:MAG: hypothetical protein IPJ41_08825 [Phycisphaerales bacterium]|nr:hypothetical protein [Phycisphaerales bacterium]